MEMDGKNLNRFFKKRYGSVANRNLINYKQLRLDFLTKTVNTSTIDTTTINDTMS